MAGQPSYGLRYNNRVSESPLSIGEVLRDARLGDLRALAEGREPYDLFGSSQRLFALLRERRILYVLVGGMAMLQYVAGRNTRDIDLIMSSEDLARLPELEAAERDRDFVRASFEGVQIGILLTANPLFQLVREQYSKPRPFAEGEVVCATPEGLALLKLFALPSLYRQGDTVRATIYEADIRHLLDQQAVDPGPLLDALLKIMPPTDIDELRRIVRDIQAGMRRFE